MPGNTVEFDIPIDPAVFTVKIPDNAEVDDLRQEAANGTVSQKSTNGVVKQEETPEAHMKSDVKTGL